MQDANDIIKGDKIIVLRGEYKGKRGTVDTLNDESARVIFSDGEKWISIDLLQNFSAAARKAWRTRPDHAAGRKKDLSLSSKRMVSLRLEADLWEELGQAAENGWIHSRESAVNQWLREKLEEINVDKKGKKDLDLH